ncbi:MAG: IS200/IS605 family transposase [Planctomycetes bacterium]|nr:IS200/IS605 family transposase [Planctomycetota bacterium]
MSHTFTQLTVHAVFSTKERRRLIPADHAKRIHGYMATLINNRFGFAREIGGTPDHVHILFDIKQVECVADCMEAVKSVSSGWVHDTFPDLRDFAWQEGYGAFSVSASSIPRVRAYIRGQEAHHKTRSFEDEFKALLKRHGIQYDERYLWK